MTVAAPARRPCPSCPYRRDVPSGVWEAIEYAKLPAYDLPTAEQPHALFMCHQQDGRVCAGWCGTHDMGNNLAVRMATVGGRASSDVLDAILDYSTDVPLHGSGAAAAEHGIADIAHPSGDARAVIGKITAARAARKSKS